MKTVILIGQKTAMTPEQWERAAEALRLLGVSAVLIAANPEGYTKGEFQMFEVRGSGPNAWVTQWQHLCGAVGRVWHRIFSGKPQPDPAPQE